MKKKVVHETGAFCHTESLALNTRFFLTAMVVDGERDFFTLSYEIHLDQCQVSGVTRLYTIP